MAHRLVLATVSRYFDTRLTGQFKDALDHIVDIHEMESRIFALALDYMYDGWEALATSERAKSSM